MMTVADSETRSDIRILRTFDLVGVKKKQSISMHFTTHQKDPLIVELLTPHEIVDVGLLHSADAKV